jgi:hypothetical protein
MPTDTGQSADFAAGTSDAEQAASTTPQSNVPWLIGAAIAAVVIAVAAIVLVGQTRTQSRTDAAGPLIDTNPELLASTAGQAHGETVDGIQGGRMEQLLFHIHAHLAIYVQGQHRLVPYGIGIVPPYKLENTPSGAFVSGGSKFYWLHTHDETGIIHIESPQQRTFTLGNLFDIWHQPLGPTQVGPAAGQVAVLVNNHPVSGDPRAIPLGAHDVIQVNVDSAEPFHPYTFPTGE